MLPEPADKAENLLQAIGLMTAWLESEQKGTAIFDDVLRDYLEEGWVSLFNGLISLSAVNLMALSKAWELTPEDTLRIIAARAVTGGADHDD